MYGLMEEEIKNCGGEMKLAPEGDEIMNDMTKKDIAPMELKKSHIQKFYYDVAPTEQKSILENQIDQLIFELYGLMEEEIKNCGGKMRLAPEGDEIMNDMAQKDIAPMELNKSHTQKFYYEVAPTEQKSILEKQIDHLFFELYGLMEEEIKNCGGEMKLTPEEGEIMNDMTKKDIAPMELNKSHIQNSIMMLLLRSRNPFWKIK